MILWYFMVWGSFCGSSVADSCRVINIAGDVFEAGEAGISGQMFGLLVNELLRRVDKFMPVAGINQFYHNKNWLA